MPTPGDDRGGSVAGVTPAWDATPVATIERSARSADWVDRWWRSSCRDGTPDRWLSIDLGLKPPDRDFSTPLYPADRELVGPADRRRVWPRGHGFNGRFAIAPGARVPMSKACRPSGGTDGHLAVQDPVDGAWWDMWGCSTPWAQTPDRPQAHGAHQRGRVTEGGRTKNVVSDVRYDVVAATVIRVPDLTLNGGASGAGLPLAVGVVRPEEVAAGEIRHAVAMTVNAACSMSGPEAPFELDIDDPTIGTIWAAAAMPCGQYESAEVPTTPVELRRMVPDGVRFAITHTDREIDAWLTYRSYAGPVRAVARTFARALRDYGWITKHTGWGNAQVQGDGSPQAQRMWRDLLGQPGWDGTDLLRDLIPDRDHVVAYRPPIGVRADGSVTTRSAGDVVAIRYP